MSQSHRLLVVRRVLPLIALGAAIVCGVTASAWASSQTQIAGTGSAAAGSLCSGASLITASDGQYAEAFSGNGGPTGALQARSFDFQVPADSLITGIEVSVKRHGDGSFDYNTPFDWGEESSGARLVRAGLEAGAWEPSTRANWSYRNEETYVFGSPTDLWGTSWTPADVDSPSFGVDLNPLLAGISNVMFSYAYVDAVWITVYYSGGSQIPAPTVEATYGEPAASPDGSGVCSDPRYLQVPRVQAACNELVQDPVNLATGAATASVTDAQMPALGEPFRLVRSYTSLDTTSGELGVGWTDSYDASLSFGDGSVTWRAGTGARIEFTEQPDGSYQAPVWATETLTATTSGYEVVTANQMHYGFDSTGHLVSIEDRNGEGVTLGYDGQGERSSLTDSSGRTVTFTHDGNGLLTKVTLPDGRYVGYGYTNGYLTSVTDLRGNQVTYSYDAAGRLQSEIDQNQHEVFHNTYGSDGRVVMQKDGDGNTTQFGWDAASATATVTDARSKQWTYQFISGTLLLNRTDPNGARISYGYDPDTGDLTSYQDALGNTVSMTYDSRHNMLTRTVPAPLSYKETWTFNTLNEPLSYTDGRGNETDYAYDTIGNLTSVMGPDPDGSGPLSRPVTAYTLDPSGDGLVTAITDARGKTTHFAYDPTTHQEISLTTPLGEETTFSYDETGRLSASVDPRGNVSGAAPSDYTTTYGYDNADHTTSVTSPDPDGSGPQSPLVTQWTYDSAGNLQSTQDARGDSTDYSYDSANRLTSVTAPDPDGAGPLTRPVTSYTYDEVGDVKSRTVALTHTTTYAYDDADRLTSVTAPGGELWTYTYDDDGNRLTRTDANGNATPTGGDGVTHYGYDVLGRLTSLSYSDSTPPVSYSYDARNNLTQITDGAGTETRTYDALGQLSNVTRGADTFAYLYDSDGNLTQSTYPDGTAVTDSYDDDSRLTGVSSGSATTAYGYDPAGEIQTTTLPSSNGYVETRSYDRAGRLTGVSNKKGTSTLSAFAYTLDPVGDPTTIAITRGTNSETDSLAYDDLNRITSICYQASCPGSTDPKISWTYDAVGNRLTETRSTGTTNYTYNSDDQLTQAGSTAYTYDADGNEKSAGSTSFTYDLENRLTSSTTGSTTTTYTYDGEGKRLQASFGSRANQKTNYLWDINHTLPQIAIERDGSNALLRREIYGARRISMTTSSATYYFAYDPLGSAINLTSSTGSTEWTDSFEPFGGIHSETKNDNKAPADVFKFAGEYLDGTGLYFLRARQYDSSTGRFLTTDAATSNPELPYTSSYVYASNVPTALIDPSGMGAIGGGCQSVWCTITGTIGNLRHTATCEAEHPLQAAGTAASYTIAGVFAAGGVKLFLLAADSEAPGVLAEISHPVDVALPSALQEGVAVVTGVTAIKASQATANTCE